MLHGNEYEITSDADTATAACQDCKDWKCRAIKMLTSGLRTPRCVLSEDTACGSVGVCVDNDGE